MVRASYDATTQARTAKFQMEITAKGAPIQISADGAMQFKPRKLRMTMTMPNMGTMQLRQLPQRFYMKMPKSAGASLPAGKAWVEFDPNKVQGQPLGGALQQMRNQSPAQTLAYVRSISKVTKKGTAKVRGVQTTRYHVLVDLKKLARGNQVTQQQVQQLRKMTGKDTLPTDVWLDGQDRIRRQRISMKIGNPSAGNPSSGNPSSGNSSTGNPSSGQKVDMRITMNMFDYDTSVTIKRPPKKKTIGFQQMRKQQQGAS